MFKHLTLAVLAAASISTQAEMVELTGEDFIFSYDNTTVFGDAEVVGNSFFFLPTNYFVSATSGETTISSEILKLKIVAKDDSAAKIETISLTEKGDYLIRNEGSVKANARLEIFSLTQSTYSDDIHESTGMLSGDTSLGNVEWEVNLDHDLSWGPDTAIQFTLENDLVAAALNEGDYARIAKKSAYFEVTVNEVPVPAAAWLFGSALVGLAGLKRKQ